jgi:RNA polymerase sigma-70 factor (ECF subfamily)
MDSSIEQTIRESWSAGEYQQAAALSIESYGSEIFGFLVAFTRTESDADDVFSSFLEDIWRGLPRFDWRCTLRAWAYTLARHAALRFASRSERRRRRQVPLSAMPPFVEAADRVRTETLRHLRTSVKSRIRELRQQLPEREQMLLVLRIDRDLSWREIALILADDAQPTDEAALERSSSALRKQLERTKEKLKKLAMEDGLLEPE